MYCIDGGQEFLRVMVQMFEENYEGENSIEDHGRARWHSYRRSLVICNIRIGSLSNYRHACKILIFLHGYSESPQVSGESMHSEQSLESPR